MLMLGLIWVPLMLLAHIRYESADAEKYPEAKERRFLYHTEGYFCLFMFTLTGVVGTIKNYQGEATIQDALIYGLIMILYGIYSYKNIVKTDEEADEIIDKRVEDRENLEM